MNGRERRWHKLRESGEVDDGQGDDSSGCAFMIILLGVMWLFWSFTPTSDDTCAAKTIELQRQVIELQGRLEKTK